MINVTNIRKIPHPFMIINDDSIPIKKKIIVRRKSLSKSKGHSSIDLPFVPLSDTSEISMIRRRNRAKNSTEIQIADNKSKNMKALNQSHNVNVSIHEITFDKKDEKTAIKVDEISYIKLNPIPKQKRNHSSVDIPRIQYQKSFRIGDIGHSNNESLLNLDSKNNPRSRRNSVKALTMQEISLQKPKAKVDTCVLLYKADELKKIKEIEEARQVKHKRLKEDSIKQVKKHRFDQFRIDLKNEKENLSHLIRNITQSQIVKDENMKYFLSKTRLKLHDQGFLPTYQYQKEKLKKR